MSTLKNKPKVSIVTPSYNQGSFIEETILSVINQTYSNIQYIIIDGGSNDNTIDVINKYRDRIDIIISEEDKGQSDAINKGFKLADGELIGWINSDDILYPKCVENIVKLYIGNPCGSIYYNCNNYRIADNGDVVGITTRKIRDRKYLLNWNYSIIQQGSFYKRELVKSVGYLNVEAQYCMDLDLWLKLSNLAPIIYSDNRPLSAIRVWQGTKTNIGAQIFVRDIRKLLKDNGASFYVPTIIYTFWIMFKIKLKIFVKHVIKKLK